MKVFKPRVTSVRAILLTDDLVVPAGHYLLIGDGDTVTSMSAEQFNRFYAPEEEFKSQPVAKPKMLEAPKRKVEVKDQSRTLSGSGAAKPGTDRHKVMVRVNHMPEKGWMTPAQVHEFLPEVHHASIYSVLAYLGRNGLIKMDRSNPYKVRYAALNYEG